MKEYGIESGDKVEKVHVALLFNKSKTSTPDWVQLAKATENTITMNAETESYDFITDKNPTTLIKKFSPQLTESLTLFKGEEDYNYFFDLFYNMPTGADAQGEILVVFMNEYTETGSGETKVKNYKAWKSACTYVLDNLDPVNSQLNFSVQFNGTVAKGSVTIEDGEPTFVEA